MIEQTKTHFITSNNGFKIFDFLNQSVPVLMGIFIFFNPFPHTTAIKEISFYLSVVIVVILILFKRTKISLKTPLLVPFGLFVFWSFLSIFFALDKQYSIGDFYSHLIRYIILYLILNNSLSERFANGFKHIPTNFVGFITLFAIMLTLNNIFTDNHLYRRAFLLICLFSLSAATFLTQARGFLIGLFIADGIMLIKNKKHTLIFTLILLIIVAVTPLKKRFSLEGILHNERLPNYSIMFEVIKSYPIIGIGFGMQTYGKYINLKDYQKKSRPTSNPYHILC